MDPVWRHFATAIRDLVRERYDEDVQELRRITVNPTIMGGKACIRGMRVTVGMIVESIAAGRSIAELLADFPYLEEQDIREALAYAAGLAQGRDEKRDQTTLSESPRDGQQHQNRAVKVMSSALNGAN